MPQRRFARHIRRFRRDERGATVIEYGILATVICLAIVGAVTALGGQVAAMYTAVANAFPK
ncbi:Flp family type IVb pilin [Terrarubrum flagellatum]|uniref:Flp family type IVb pilin n=1 Tax=Terrirubrum flagellatum TaxID=2895980 RepID=UPI003145443F